MKDIRDQHSGEWLEVTYDQHDFSKYCDESGYNGYRKLGALRPKGPSITRLSSMPQNTLLRDHYHKLQLACSFPVMVVQAFPHLAFSVMRRIAAGDDGEFMQEFATAAGLHDASPFDIKKRYENAIATVMFGDIAGDLPEHIGALEFVRQGQSDIAMVYQAMNELYPDFVMMIRLYQADLGRPYTDGDGLYWLLTDMLAVVMRKSNRILSDKGYLFHSGCADNGRLSCGFCGDNILISSAHISASQLDDFIPHLQNMVYEDTRTCTSTSTGLRVRFARVEMDPYYTDPDGAHDDSATTYDTTMGAKPTLARCIRKLTKPHVELMSDLKSYVVERSRKLNRIRALKAAGESDGDDDGEEAVECEDDGDEIKRLNEEVQEIQDAMRGIFKELFVVIGSSLKLSVTNGSAVVVGYDEIP